MHHHWLFPTHQMTKRFTNYGMTFYAKNHLMMLQNFTFYIRFVTVSSNQNRKPLFKAWGSIQTKYVAQRNRSGLKSKSSNKPESSTGKSGSNSQSVALASKSVKQKKYTPEAVDQLRLNFSSPDLCFQNLLAIGSAENANDFLEYLSEKELTCLLKALDKPCHDKKSKEKQIAELLSALNEKPRHCALPEHLSAIKAKK